MPFIKWKKTIIANSFKNLQKDSLEQIYLSRMRSLEEKKHVSGATSSKTFFFKYYRQMMI